MNTGILRSNNRFTLFQSVFALAALTLTGLGASAGHHGKKDMEKHAKAAKPMDIVSVAVGAGQFNTLAAALTAAGLVDTLQGDGPFTVFAPTDAAFAKLPKGTVETLLLPENKDKLIAILTYHVVPGKVIAADVVKLSNAGTVNGKNLTVTVTDGNVKINDAMVTAVDVKASNGIIHVIDSVILP